MPEVRPKSRACRDVRYLRASAASLARSGPVCRPISIASNPSRFTVIYPNCSNGSTTAPFWPRSCVGRKAVDGSKTAASNQPRAHTARFCPARIRGGWEHRRALDHFDAGALAAAHRPSLRLFKEHLIYEQSTARTAREQQEKGWCDWSHRPLKIEQQLSITYFLFNLLYQRLRFSQLPSIPLWTPSGKPHAGRRAYLTARCISWPISVA